MDGSELRHIARKAGQIRKHHGALGAEQIPNPLVDRILIRVRLRPFLDQPLKTLARSGESDPTTRREKHAPPPPMPGRWSLIIANGPPAWRPNTILSG